MQTDWIPHLLWDSAVLETPDFEVISDLLVDSDHFLANLLIALLEPRALAILQLTVDQCAFCAHCFHVELSLAHLEIQVLAEGVRLVKE